MIKSILSLNKGLLFEYGSTSNGSAIEQVANYVASFEDLERLRYVIHDASMVTTFDVMAREVTMIAAQTSGLIYTNSKLCQGYVTSNEKMADAFDRVNLLIGHRFVRFDSIEDAKQWGLSLPA